MPPHTTGDLLLIRTLGYDWAVAGDDLEDVLAHRRAVRAPGSAAFVEGIVRYRDGVLPVVDLARRFRLPPGSPPPPPPPREGRRTLVVRVSGGLAGLTVDEVVGSRGVQGVQVIALPRRASSPVARGCLVGPAGDLVVVLDPRLVLETDEPLDLPLPASWAGTAEDRQAEETRATPPAPSGATPSAPPTGASPRPAGDEAEFLVIRTLGLDWAVAGDDLEDTIAYRKAVRAPGSPPFIEGVVRYGDGLLPVVDLARRFRLPPGSPAPPPPPREGRRTLVVRVSGGLAGLTVDEVVGSRDAQGAQVVALPRLARSPVARGCLVEPAGHLLVVLDPRRILETDDPLDLPLPAGWRQAAEHRPPAPATLPAPDAAGTPPGSPRRAEETPAARRAATDPPEAPAGSLPRAPRAQEPPAPRTQAPHAPRAQEPPAARVPESPAARVQDPADSSAPESPGARSPAAAPSAAHGAAPSATGTSAPPAPSAARPPAPPAHEPRAERTAVPPAEPPSPPPARPAAPFPPPPAEGTASPDSAPRPPVPRPTRPAAAAPPLDAPPDDAPPRTAPPRTVPPRAVPPRTGGPRRPEAPPRPEPPPPAPAMGRGVAGREPVDPRRVPAGAPATTPAPTRTGGGAPARAWTGARPRRGRRVAAVAVVVVALGAAFLLARRDAGDEPARVAVRSPARPDGALASSARAERGVQPDPPREAPGAGEPPTATPREEAGPTRAAEPLVLTLEEGSGRGAVDSAGENGPVEVVQYTVVRGDTLWAIARRYTQNPFRYREIASDNDLRNPNLIFPGQRLTLRIRRLPRAP